MTSQFPPEVNVPKGAWLLFCFFFVFFHSQLSYSLSSKSYFVSYIEMCSICFIVRVICIY